jgi:hypothetical protein
MGARGILRRLAEAMAGASEGETWSPGDLAECITACAWIDGDGARHPGPQLREIRMVIDIAFLPVSRTGLISCSPGMIRAPIAPTISARLSRAPTRPAARPPISSQGSRPRVFPNLPQWLRGVISMHLTNWTARRSGANMVLNGTNEQGEKVKITGVFLIKSGAAGLMAHCPKDQWHTLSTT